MEDTTTNETILKGILEEFALGAALQQGALQVFPLLRRNAEKQGHGAAGRPTLRGWRFAEELLQEGHAELREVDEGGEVSRLAFENRSGAHALLLDGLELRGCKQNRMINTTMLAGAGQTTPVDVSCVEAGRWDYRSSTFSSSGRMVAGKLRNRKAHMVRENLDREGRAATDQRAVWREVDDILDHERCESPTRALDDAYEKLAGKEGRPVDLAVDADGAIVAIDGEILGLDLLGDRTTFASFWKAASAGYALDAKQARGSKSISAEEVDAWLRVVASRSAAKPIEVPGVGEHHSVSGPGLSGTVLFHEGALVHAAVFPVLS